MRVLPAALIACLVAGFTLAPASSAAGARLLPDLEAALAAAGPLDVLHVVVLTDGPSGPYADVAEALGARVEWEYTLIDGFSAFAAPGVVLKLAKTPGIVQIETARKMVTTLDVSTRDIRADKAWAAGWNGTGITVAVLDTGWDRIETVVPASAVVACVSANWPVVAPGCDDTDGHGTHVASTVASRSAGIPGVAPRAALAIVRVLHAGGTGLSTDIIKGMEWVVANRNTISPPVRVVTMSIGYENPGCGDGRDAMAQAADAVVAANLTFTVAAGNAGHTRCTIDGASAAFNVVTVGAVDDRQTPDHADDTLATFSSAGPTKDGRQKPEIMAPGVGIRAAYLGPIQSGLSGTSMATPHVAGVVADLLHKEPWLSAAQVKARLTSEAYKPAAAPALPHKNWGWGLVDACDALQLTTC
ncbi:MAG TPA: S8 family serine peptidase [Candidatus Thermoplasmatota archaeon]|nr:S8 family serine peptidase [Candidatus Thermoplasmatota archaeon]